MTEKEKISIDIEEKDGIIYCTVEVPRYGRFYKNKHVIRESDAISYLGERGYQTSNLICISGGQLSNKHVNSNCKFTWAFKVNNPPKQVKKRTTRAKPRAPKKTP